MSTMNAVKGVPTKALPTKVLPMDVIDLTLILKSIGFRLESIDFNASRFSGGRIADWKADEVISSPAKSSANDSQFISVDISCGKSKIISRMSYRLSNDAQCTCPKQDATVDNSFWDIQSSGSFANHRPSLNAVAKKDENGIDHDTTSNLLPVLSERAIAMTQVLAQVLLKTYSADIKLGKTISTKDYDIESIMNALKTSPATPSSIKVDDLNLETPQSSLNVTPEHIKNRDEVATTAVPDTHHHDGAGEMVRRNMALEDSVNTEAFVSPKNGLFTSSPCGGDATHNAPNIERDANIIHNLNQAKYFVDNALVILKLNVTRNVSEDSSALLTVTPHFPNNTNVSRFDMAPPTPFDDPENLARRMSQQMPPLVPEPRARKTLIAATRPISAASSRSNSSLSSIGRPATTTKWAPIKRAVAIVPNRIVSGASNARSALSIAAGMNKSRAPVTVATSVSAKRSNIATPNSASSTGSAGSSSALTARRSLSSIKPPKPPTTMVISSKKPATNVTLSKK